MLSTAKRLVFFTLLFSLLIAKSSAASFACNNDDSCAGCYEDGDGNPVDGSNDCYWEAVTGNGGECRKKSGHGHCQVNDDDYDDDDDDDDDYGACCCYHNPGQWEYFCTTPENCEYHGDTCEDISNCESFNSCKDMDDDDDDDDDDEALHLIVGLIVMLLPVVLCCCCCCLYYNNKKKASANVHGTPQEKPVTLTFQQPEQHQQQENPKPITLTFQQPVQPELMGLQMTKTPQQQMQPQIAVPMVPALAAAPVAVPVPIMPALAAAPAAAPVLAPVEMVEVDVPFWGGGTAVSVIYKDRLIMVDVPKDAPPGTKMMLPVPESEL
jgi:hypothetical protein